ncbi:hypothetical protein EVAR_67294_1 [Eumeta japonica]|uniref:Uncharacterized protein n=1 Tax=Eumeta variegata TaxID=151549 RepID=A0A4C1SXX4_EUMVA|nr:hypothetical protein EVAR_67294_1 [Eumeta japonica]
MYPTCEFMLNRANATYYTGESIKCHIALRTYNEEAVEDVSITFMGQTNIDWRNSIMLAQTVTTALMLENIAIKKLPITCGWDKPSLPWHSRTNGTYYYSVLTFSGAYVPGQTIKYVLKKSNHFATSHSLEFYQKVTSQQERP